MTVAGQARGVIDFWFALTGEQQFAKDAALDAQIAERFDGLRDALLESQAEGWRDSAETMLAAIIVLDQFSRNIHRGSAQAFAADDLCVELTLEAVRAGMDRDMAPAHAAFLYMPLMHAEHLGLQRFAITLFRDKGLDEQVRFGIAHAEVIERFGRFPSRNAAIGRASTPAEKEYLSQPGAGW